MALIDDSQDQLKIYHSARQLHSPLEYMVHGSIHRHLLKRRLLKV